MAVDIPLVIQTEILCRVPIKSLIRFTSVSKEWKSIIHSSEFNSDYIVRQVHRKCLITAVVHFNDDVDKRTSRNYSVSGEKRWPDCWIFDDDDTFPKHKVCLTYPLSLNQLKNTPLQFHGSSHGLLCFSANRIDDDDTFVRCFIWNPSIRKSIAIESPYYRNVKIAFGVCPKSLDPKIVKINIYDVPYGLSHYEQRRVWRVEVFTLSSRVWRSPFVKLSNKWFNVNFWSKTPLVINGFIYWCAYVTTDYKDRIACARSFMIISFDLATEEFAKIHVPDELVHNCFDIFKLGESVVAVSESYLEDCKVWLMDHVSKSFTMLYTVKLPESMTKLGCTDNNQLIIIDYPGGELVAYDLDSKQRNNLGIYVDYNYSPSFTSYTESLLLLDRSNTLNDDEGGDARCAI